MEFRVTITVGDHGSEDNLEPAFDAFLEVAPDAGPVVDVNTAANTFTVTFSVEADSIDHAALAARKAFATSMKAAGLGRTEVLNVNFDAISAAAELQRDLQPA